MDIAFAIFLLFIFLVVVVPYLLFVSTNYEAPASFRESLRDAAGKLLIVAIVAALYNLVRFGTSFEVWRWDFLIAVIVAAPAILAIDWLVQRHRKTRETL